MRNTCDRPNLSQVNWRMSHQNKCVAQFACQRRILNGNKRMAFHLERNWWHWDGGLNAIYSFRFATILRERERWEPDERPGRENYLPSRFDGWRGWDFSVSACITRTIRFNLAMEICHAVAAMPQPKTNFSQIHVTSQWTCVSVCGLVHLYPCTHHRPNMLRYKIFSAEQIRVTSCSLKHYRFPQMVRACSDVQPAQLTLGCIQLFCSVFQFSKCDLYWVVHNLALDNRLFRERESKGITSRTRGRFVEFPFHPLVGSIMTCTHTTHKMGKRWWRRGPLMRKVIARTVHAPPADAFAC